MPTNDELQVWNQSVISEFRANAGQVREPSFPILLLTTTGARTGRRITTPLAYQCHEARLLVVASGAGAARDPMWCRNLRANPAVTVEVGGDAFDAAAVELHGADRDRLYNALAAENATYREYESSVDRAFPVIELVPRSERARSCNRQAQL